MLFWAYGDRIWCLFLKQIESEPLFIAGGHGHRQEMAGVEAVQAPLRQGLGVGPFPGPLPPCLSLQGSACGILTSPRQDDRMTGCSLCFRVGGRGGTDLGEGMENFSQDWSLGPRVPYGNGWR